jgi:SAM-dependent methyltransferase
MSLTRHEVLASKAFNAPHWYYSMELAPGVWTQGADYQSVALTREILRRATVEGHHCLDIGIMEGLVTVLLERRGASKVVGYDRVARQGKLSLVRAALDCTFEHVAGMRLSDLPSVLAARGHSPFDLVVFSGVLYHMFDPLAGLATVRGLVRDGGLLIVETSAAMTEQMVAYFNSKGRYRGGTNYWEISTGLLEYHLRMLRLRPLDCVWAVGHRRESDPQIGRVAIACRAVDHALPEPDDQWMDVPQLALDLAEFVDWERTTSRAPAVAYDDNQPSLVRRSVELGIDVCACTRSVPAFVIREEQARLTLQATS